MQANKIKNNSKTRDMVETALLVALVFIATAFVNIRLPIAANGGLVHLGTVMACISSIVFGKKKGALAGSIGMGLFDLTSGWAVWAPFTFIIRGVMGYVLGYISYLNNKNGNSIVLNLIGIIISGILMIGGYYITEVILYGNLIAPLASIPGDIVQVLVAIVISLPVSKILKRYF